jgi:hypothetical protein
MWYHQSMRLRLLLASVSIASASVVSAQPKPAAQKPNPCSQTDLTLAFARAMPYKTFLDTDTTYTAFWAAAEQRAGATVAAVMRETPPPAGVWRLLVVAENSCSDALASLPYIARLVDRMPRSELRILRKADAQPLLDAHLFNGRIATPLVLVLDSEFRERGAWIERASHIQKYVTANEGKMPDDTLWARVRVMRSDDDGRTPLREIIALMRDSRSQDATTPAGPSKGRKTAKPIEPCKVP